jgi:predicted nucleic acid-binding protein
MMIEAKVKKFVTSSNVAKKLRKKPHIVKQLSDYYEQAQSILEMELEILPLSLEIVAASERCRREYGLLVNDSVTVALALNQGITVLASADRDFERVKELVVYSPQDVKIIEGMEGTI